MELKIYFFDDGTVKRADLAKNANNIEVGGKPYSFRKGHEIEFHESGAVKGAYLAHRTKVIEIGGTPYSFAKGSWIYFHENGEVEFGILDQEAKDVEVGSDTYSFKERTRMEFSDRGRVISGHLSEPKQVCVRENPYDFMIETEVIFNEDGDLVSANDRGKVIFDFRAQDPVAFWEAHGKVDDVVLTEDTDFNIGGDVYTFVEGSKLIFYKSGALKGGVLGAPKEIEVEGTPAMFPIGTRIEFNEDGEISSAMNYEGGGSPVPPSTTLLLLLSAGLLLGLPTDAVDTDLLEPEQSGLALDDSIIIDTSDPDVEVVDWVEEDAVADYVEDTHGRWESAGHRTLRPQVHGMRTQHRTATRVARLMGRG